MAKANPNQKFIKVHKEKCDEEHLYARINIEAMDKAAKDLEAGAFKLWMYIAKNQNGYSFGLSSADAESRFGMGKSQYDTAVKKLIDKGYLVSNGGQEYSFYEISSQENNTTKSFVVLKQHNESLESDKRVVLKSNNENPSLFENQTTTVVLKQYNEEDKDVSLQENNTTSLYENQTTVVGKSFASLQENNTTNIIYTTQIQQEDTIPTIRYSDVLRLFEEGTYEVKGGICYKDDGKKFRVEFDF